MERLKELSKSIKNWQGNKLNHFASQKKELMKEIECIDQKEFQNQLSTEDNERRTEIEFDLCNIDLKET